MRYMADSDRFMIISGERRYHAARAAGLRELPCIEKDVDDGETMEIWNPGPGSCGGGSMLAPPAYNPPFNRNGKTVKISAYTALGDTTAQKNWLNTIGPLVVGMDIYSDFFGWSGSVPYTKSATATFDGSHVMLAVGYDDNLKCWIVKNSWGTGYGNAGYYLIGYGQCNIDVNSKLGFQYSNPDPWTKRRGHSGGMIESGAMLRSRRTGWCRCISTLSVATATSSSARWSSPTASCRSPTSSTWPSLAARVRRRWGKPVAETSGTRRTVELKLPAARRPSRALSSWKTLRRANASRTTR